MNYDIWYNIGIHLDYDTLLMMGQINHQFANIYTNNYFWLLKCQNDFLIKEEKFDEIVSQVKSGKETYLFWAGINGIPLIGAERYGNLTKLTIAAGASGNNRLIEHYHNLLPEEIFRPLAEHNNSLMLNKLLNKEEEFYHRNWTSAFVGALIANRKELINTLGHEKVDYNKINFACAAITGNSLSNLILVTNIYTIDLTNARLLYKACVVGNKDIINYLLDNGSTNYNSGLEGAAYRGDLELISLMLKLGATNVNGAMIEAAESGHIDIVLDMLNRGAEDLNEALIMSAEYGKLEMVKMLISLGADNYTKALEEAAWCGHLLIVKYLLSKTDNLKEALKLAIRHGHYHVVDLLLEEIGPLSRRMMAKLLRLAVQRGHLLICLQLINLGADPLNTELISEAISHNQFMVINREANYLPYVYNLKSSFGKYLSST